METSLTGKIASYFSCQPVVKAWLFGSFSRGEERIGSDIDILVEIEPGSHLGFRFFGMINDLEKICGRKVDLVESGMLDSHVAPSVYHDRVLIYERTRQR